MQRTAIATRSVRTKATAVLRGAFTAILLAIFLFAVSQRAGADAPNAAAAGFDTYITQLESRLARQHASADGFLASFDSERVRGGEVIVEQITPAAGTSVPGAMLHHWRGTAFVAGATAADLERLLRDYSAYPRVYAPQVLSARVLARDGNHYQTMLRLSQKHVIAVLLDTTYDVQFFPAEAKADVGRGARGHNLSHSTRIAEIANPGTATEYELDSRHEHGFLWRLNTYWCWEERDGGIYMQIETVELTRTVPVGLGWAIGPLIESIPRESLDFTLKSTANALRR
jgi:hypothetical protein